MIADALESTAAGQPCAELQLLVAKALGIDQNSTTLNADLSGIVSKSLVNLSSHMEGVMLKGEDAAVIRNDPFCIAASEICSAYTTDRDETKALCSERDSLFTKLLVYQRANSEETFYPDCNGSLRISAGHVEGCR